MPDKPLTYQEVLIDRGRTGWIGTLFEIARKLGYPYFMWNDRIYKIEKDWYAETELTVKNIK